MHGRRSTTAVVFLFLFGALPGCSLFPWGSPGNTEKGIASWYGPEHHGKRTASGEVFDQWAMTAAHKELPFDSVVLVRNLNNGQSVTVRINDRGPFVRGRVIDLSRGAAGELSMVRDGIVPVRIEVLKWGREEPHKKRWLLSKFF
ncbi:MAG: septal ring lytic transglycosylase RlpA family protein [Candidatus Hydrogenedentes bacterium]|nr:septal ring lytic transglycosylase RlpA family protein [Candidatus Hydrogenedentota bacterium]